MFTSLRRQHTFQSSSFQCKRFVSTWDGIVCLLFDDFWGLVQEEALVLQFQAAAIRINEDKSVIDRSPFQLLPF
jgi:hypothetical protein